MQIPVYLFTGFLEAGKTKFIQETMEDIRFNNGEKTLILLCEEGLEEYDESKFSSNKVYIETIENEESENGNQTYRLLCKYKKRNEVCDW